MELESLLFQLSHEDAAALRLRMSGHPDTLIADALGIETDGVPDVMRRAGANLVHLAIAAANATD
ncbi:MAG: hypothetical protein ACRDO8_14270 [Nocardioidaceae bacterium]